MPAAARMGDPIGHGGAPTGTITKGFETVLIGGQPAARVGDPHKCEMWSGLVPHLGGTISPPGSPTVLIGGQPAARMNDLAACAAGGPASILFGFPTVLIGP